MSEVTVEVREQPKTQEPIKVTAVCVNEPVREPERSKPTPHPDSFVTEWGCWMEIE